MNRKSFMMWNLVLAGGLGACGDSAKKGAAPSAPAPDVRTVGEAGSVNLQGAYKLAKFTCNDRDAAISEETKDSFRVNISDKDVSFKANGSDADSGIKCAIESQAQIVELNYEASEIKLKQLKSVANCVDAQGNKLPEQNLLQPDEADKIETSHFNRINDRQIAVSNTLDQDDSITNCKKGETQTMLLERE